MSIEGRKEIVLGNMLLKEGRGNGLTCGIMTGKERVDVWMDDKLLHEDGRKLNKVGGATGAGKVVEVGATEHRVHGVPHLMEEGLDLVQGKEGGRVT